MVQLLRNVNKTIEAESTEFKIAQREVSSSKRESSVDANSDDEEEAKQSTPMVQS